MTNVTIQGEYDDEYLSHYENRRKLGPKKIILANYSSSSASSSPVSYTQISTFSSAASSSTSSPPSATIATVATTTSVNINDSINDDSKSTNSYDFMLKLKQKENVNEIKYKFENY